MLIKRTSILSISGATAFAELCKSGHLCEVAKGMITYDNQENFPEKWQLGEQINLLPRLKGISQGNHFVTFTCINEDAGILITSEHGGHIKSWKHVMTVKELPNGHCEYRDHVTIKAGWRTPMIWLFAQVFYRHRHRQWKKMLAQQQI